MGALAAAGVVGAGLGIARNVISGNAEEDALWFKSNEAHTNAYNLRQSAGDAALRGSVDAQRPLLQAGQVVGKQQAAAGASGISTGSAQVQGVEASSEAMGRLDSNTILNNAYREAWGLRQQSASQDRQASQYAHQAMQVPMQTFLGSIGSALGGAGQAIGGAGGSSGGGDVSI